MLRLISCLALLVAIVVPAKAQPLPAVLTWEITIDYFWGGGRVVMVIPDNPGVGGVVGFDSLHGISRIKDMTFHVDNATSQFNVEITAESPFTAPPCSRQLTGTFPVQVQSGEHTAQGSILHVFPGGFDDCLKLSTDITFSARAVKNSYSFGGGVPAVGPKNFSVYTLGLRIQGDSLNFILNDPDVVATGAGTQFILANEWGLNVTVHEQTHWVAWRLGGLIYRPTGHFPSSANFHYTRTAVTPPCFLPDFCIMIDVPPGKFRVRNADVLNCPVGQKCLDVNVTLTDVTPADRAVAADVSSKVKLTVNTGSGELVTPDGTVLTVNAGQTVELTSPPPAIYAAVLPASRSVQVPNTATAFASIVNAGPGVANNCSIAADATQGLPVELQYQTTDPQTNTPTGESNTAVQEIAVNQVQTFLFAVKPTAPIASTDMRLVFNCASATVTPVVGLNTFLLSASTDPVPDIIAIGATTTNDGIANVPGTTGTGFFAAAGINIGTAATITASADDGGRGLPLSLSICQTDPVSGACLSPPAASTTTTFNSNATLTYTVFAQGVGNIPFDPANNRLFLRFKDGDGVTRGATNVAVRTQ